MSGDLYRFRTDGEPAPEPGPVDPIVEASYASDSPGVAFGEAMGSAMEAVLQAETRARTAANDTKRVLRELAARDEELAQARKDLRELAARDEEFSDEIVRLQCELESASTLRDGHAEHEKTLHDRLRHEITVAYAEIYGDTEGLG